MSFNLRLANHPAQARNPVTNAPLFDADGVPVPLFPDQRSVYLDGFLVAYVNASGNISFIMPESKLTAPIVQAIRDLVSSEFTPAGTVNHVPDLPEVEADDWDDEEEAGE